MTRSNIALSLIGNEHERRNTYTKRLEGLCRRMEELCSLFYCKGCIVIPNPQVEREFVWPSGELVRDLFLRFLCTPKDEQEKKMVSHDGYIVDALRGEIVKHKIKNKKMEATILIHKMRNGRGMAEIKNLGDAKLLTWYAEEKIQDVLRHILLSPPLPKPAAP